MYNEADKDLSCHIGKEATYQQAVIDGDATGLVRG